MPIQSGIPIIPSKDLEKTLRLWVDGLGFSTSSEMRKGDKLIFCMLHKDLGRFCIGLHHRIGKSGFELLYAFNVAAGMRTKARTAGIV
jgi:hypothetical protein